MRRAAWVALAPMAAALALLAAAPARAGDPPTLKRDIDRIVDRAAFAAATWGIEVRSLQDGRVLYARNALKDLKPASTLKLVTTAAALDAFGPDETLATTLETAGRLDGQGQILGDVYLVGRGDPNLSGRFSQGRLTAAFEELADQLSAAGVRRIQGRLVGSEGLFEGERRGEDWTWGDLVWCYGAEVSALSFNDNCADLKVTPGERAGDPVVVDRAPISDFYDVVSKATTSPAGSKSDVVLARAAGSNTVQLSGTLPAGAPPEELKVALEDPARYATTVLAEVLAAKGIQVGGPLATSSDALPAGLRVLARHDSPSMAETIKAVNKTSQNLHAEMLLRLLGARIKGAGTVEAGHAAVKDFLERVGAGSERWSLKDGSGLSRSDLVSPHDMVSLLAAMDRHRYAKPFRESLPVAGVDGSLANRLKGTPAEGRVLAKTGGIRNVTALAGYVTTKRGSRLAFAILVNHYTGPVSDTAVAIDSIAALLAAL